ncbi:helix-turn-helix transcriptional regulator [Brevundimonas sp. Root1279]|uniref:helix-turn-helix transcriptional regulator n=1 Tax=Brevundimonas sp. Root1279 TaxID=1736443 RepID=UPI0006F8372C|nr:helix-turn-helix transcriptional regulator [Brevundimonas sp. Root1279]KQW86678.1 hypothetical protein ASC65_01970 [Brevundimonas sp. Root1279]
MQDGKLSDGQTVAPTPRAGSGIEGRQGLYLAAWTDTFFAPGIIVTLDLSLVWMNRAATTLLERGSPFCRNGDRLACVDKALTSDLRRFVEGLDEKPSIWACPTGGEAHMLVRGEPLRPARAEAGAALFIVPTATAPEEHLWADLGDIFGLTPAETAIVKRFIAGERADEMAEALGVTIETVRTHIRRIYAKLAINSREQLFSLVSPYRLR